MNNLFQLDGPLMQFINKAVYCAYLNILWFICCIPVVTIGASTTALFYVTLKMAKNEEGNVTREFFHSFRENLKHGTKVWLILLCLGTILGVDGYVLYHMRFENIFWTLCTAFFFVAVIAYAIVLMYIFPLMARFENTTWAMLKNALFLGIRFLFCTVIMAVIYFAMLLFIVRFFTPAILFGEGLCALLCSHFLSNILLLCQEKSEEHAKAGQIYTQGHMYFPNDLPSASDFSGSSNRKNGKSFGRRV